MLVVHCFGFPQILVDDLSLSPKLSPKALAILVYLAVTGKPQRCSLLANLLWSESEPRQALANLRELLPELRKVVGQYLHFTPQTIRFKQPPDWLDVKVLQAFLTGEFVSDRQELRSVLDLYQGEFLDGFTAHNAPLFEAWLIRQRDQLHTLALGGLFRLAEQDYAAGDYHVGLAVTQRILHWEPVYEAAHRLQMRLLAASGQRSAALAQYILCRTILADELEVMPEAETTALYEAIRRGDYGIRGVIQLNNGVNELTRAGKGQLTDAAVNSSPLYHQQKIKHNLPGQLTPFIGREAELVALGAALLDPHHRLITLIGEGGVGKTRLALAAAQALVTQHTGWLDPELLAQRCAAWPDRIGFVALAALTMADTLADQLAAAIATALDFSFSGSQPLFTQLLAAVREQRLLLLLDNAEHLHPALADCLIQLLQHSHQLKLLVTSRRALNLQAETLWLVHGLPLPASIANQLPHTLLTYSSIALFVERAKRLQRTFTLTAENQAAVLGICQLVDGSPLAIELAAALTKQYQCAEIYATLQRDYRFLAVNLADLAPRHRSMSAVLDYSWQFLTPEESQSLAAFALFIGGFTRAAAMAVTQCTDTILAVLVDHSLLSLHNHRYTLHELVRQYALDRLLACGVDQPTLQERHAHYYLALLQSLADRVLVDPEAQATLQRDWDNIRVAWLWAVAQAEPTLLAMGFDALHAFYQLNGHYQEALSYLTQALAVVRQGVLTTAVLTEREQLRHSLARLLCHLAHFYRRSGLWPMGEQAATEALAIGQELKDPTLQGLAYHELTRLAYVRGDYHTMREQAEAGCQQAAQANLPLLNAESLNDLGLAAGMCSGPLAALPYCHHALAVLPSGTNQMLESFIHVNLGFFALSAHDYQQGAQELKQGIAIQQRLQARGGSIMPLLHLGDLWTALGLYSAAAQVYEEALALGEAIFSPYSQSCLYISTGRLHYLRGEWAPAQRACTHAYQVAQRAQMALQQQWALLYWGHALMASGDHTGARRCYQQAIALHQPGNWVYRTADAHAGMAALLLATNELTLALTHVDAALAILADYGLAGASEPFTVYWSALRVWQAAGEPRAASLLESAYHYLHQIADQFSELTWRQSFLEGVAVNQALLNAAQVAGLIPVAER